MRYRLAAVMKSFFSVYSFTMRSTDPALGTEIQHIFFYRLHHFLADQLHKHKSTLSWELQQRINWASQEEMSESSIGRREREENERRSVKKEKLEVTENGSRAAMELPVCFSHHQIMCLSFLIF